MTLPRRSQISVNDTPYYHCIARCVRRAFLCGEDHHSGQNFEHRREWLLERLQLQSTAFGIDVCAFAFMSNHYHLVLRIDQKRALQWSDKEVIERWTTLFSGPPLVQAYLAGEVLTLAQSQVVSDIADIWRHRLCDLSWFMRCLNEYIARKANAEDDCTGRFWEGRFKSQALLDETALLSCMAYVDLNPIRAGMATTLEGSDFTSIQARLKQLTTTKNSETPNNPTLLPFAEGRQEQQAKQYLPFHLRDYIDLVDSTARAVRSEKRGAIFVSAPRLVSQLGITQEQWLALALEIQAQSLRAIGELGRIKAYAHAVGRKWIKGQSQLSSLYCRMPT